jgi:hypothetical protein
MDTIDYSSSVSFLYWNILGQAQKEALRMGRLAEVLNAPAPHGEGLDVNDEQAYLVHLRSSRFIIRPLVVGKIIDKELSRCLN